MKRARAREQRLNSATPRPARTTASTAITNPLRAFWMVLPWPRIRCGRPMRASPSLGLMLLTTKLWWRPCLKSRWWPRALFASSRLLMSPNGLRCEIDQQTRECLCARAPSLFCASGACLWSCLRHRGSVLVSLLDLASARRSHCSGARPEHVVINGCLYAAGFLFRRILAETLQPETIAGEL